MPQNKTTETLKPCPFCAGDKLNVCETKFHGRIAYVAQQPWVMNASVKENIVFGHRWDPHFYQQTINACALADDFRTLPDGDQTEVGERGISLSGGQKARLTLARAVYGSTGHTAGETVATVNHAPANAMTKISPTGLEERLAAAIKPNTKILWLETPMNPTLGVVDVVKVSKIAKSINPSIWVVVDSTFASPWFQNPLALGADVVMHSLTKYLNGHSDVLMGAAITSSEDLAAKLRLQQASLGAVPSPFDCWLAMRGIKTLGVRMREHGCNALKLAKWMIEFSEFDLYYIL